MATQSIINEWPKADGRILGKGLPNSTGLTQIIAPPKLAVWPAAGSWRDYAIFRSTSDHEMNVESVLLQLDSTIVVPGSEDYDIKGHVVWGSGGAQYDALVDLVRGTSLVLSASSVQVDARYYCLSALPAVPGRHNVGASLSYGSRGANSSPTFTTPPATLLGGGGFMAVDVPEWATEYQVISSRPSLGLQIQQFGVSPSLWTYNNIPAIGPDWYVLPSTCVRFNCAFPPGVPAGTNAQISFIFKLCL